MLYAFVANWRAGITEQQQDAVLARRAQWKFPEGTKPVAEYWAIGGPPSGPLVYTVFEANAVTGIWQLFADWGDAFDISIVPVVTAEQGLQIGPKILAARPR